MVVVQVCVAVCVLSLWQLQEEQQQKETQEILTQQEAPERIGKYMLLFKSLSVSPARATTHPTLHKDVLRGDKVPLRSKKVTSGYGGQVKRSDSLPVLDDDGGGGGDGGDDESVRSGDDDDEKEEEDPNVGRGFLDEFVTYRSDGNSFLMLDDDHRNLKTTKITPLYNPNDSVTKNEGLVMKSYHNASSKHIPVLKTYGDQQDDTHETNDYKFQSYNPDRPLKMRMKDDHDVYFQDVGSTTCFITGTDMEGSERAGGSECRCLDGYFGVDCGIPEAVWFDTYRNKYPETHLRRRKVPRRVINGVTVNHEFAMFEARLHELYPVVDAFILAESNYTAHGDPKEFLFLKRLRRGYMKRFQDKLVYVSLNTFPKVSETSGWIADAYLRYHLGVHGLPLLKGLREDDLFVLSDADELPMREVITFLKLYDGYPEPISFALQWNMFGFFWKMPAEKSWKTWVSDEQASTVSSVVTMGMLRKVFFNNVFFIRTDGTLRYYEMFKRLKKYRDEEEHLVKNWVIGRTGHYAGWHCSWCLSPVEIVDKMNSAQANDEPRWGNMPEKKNLTYIASRIAEGVWFDDKKHFLPVRNPKQRHYAPRYLLQHPTLYHSLLYHPSHHLHQGRTRVER